MRERGLSNGVQFALIFPAVLALFFVALQWAMFAWASTIALAAAQDGAREAAAYSATEADGRAAASKTLTSDVLQDPSVTVNRGARTTTVSVSGHAISVFGFDFLNINKTVTVQTERLS